jgi:hypothetical protein
VKAGGSTTWSRSSAPREGARGHLRRRDGAQDREIFVAAVAERWRLEEQGADTRVLVIGNEDWPFPVPLIRTATAWRFDTAAGKEEVLSRRVGRNELARSGSAAPT